MSFPSSRNAIPMNRVPGSMARIRQRCVCMLLCRLRATYKISRDQPAVNCFALFPRLPVTDNSQGDGFEHSEVVRMPVGHFFLEVTAQNGIDGSHLSGELALVTLRF